MIGGLLMRKLVILALVAMLAFGLFGCDDSSTIEVDAIITEKIERDGSYFFNLEYNMEGFHEPLTAQEKVTKRIFDQYELGDLYVFKRPAPKLDR